jgi:hypothetical protein
VAVDVKFAVGVNVGVGVAPAVVGVGVAVGVAVPTAVVGVGVAVPVGVATTAVGVGVAVPVGVAMTAVGVGVAVPVGVAMTAVGVGVAVPVGVAMNVAVGVGVPVGVATGSIPASASLPTPIRTMVRKRIRQKLFITLSSPRGLPSRLDRVYQIREAEPEPSARLDGATVESPRARGARLRGRSFGGEGAFEGLARRHAGPNLASAR